MAKVYFGLGTNLGDKEANLNLAVEKIKNRIGNVISLSGFYVTDPWGFESSNPFLNAACIIETDLPPLEILAETKSIERGLGRLKKSVNGIYKDRLIDIDLLMYDDLILRTPELTLPHPLMHQRCFVMEPLAEIAPEAMHPLFKKTIQELSEAIKRTSLPPHKMLPL